MAIQDCSTGICAGALDRHAPKWRLAMTIRLGDDRGNPA